MTVCRHIHSDRAYRRHGQHPDDAIGDQVRDHECVKSDIRIAAADLFQGTPRVREVFAAAEDGHEEKGDSPQRADADDDPEEHVEEVPSSHDEQSLIEEKCAELDQPIGRDH